MFFQRSIIHNCLKYQLDVHAGTGNHACMYVARTTFLCTMTLVVVAVNASVDPLRIFVGDHFPWMFPGLLISEKKIIDTIYNFMLGRVELLD